MGRFRPDEGNANTVLPIRVGHLCWKSRPILVEVRFYQRYRIQHFSAGLKMLEGSSTFLGNTRNRCLAESWMRRLIPLTCCVNC